MDHSPPVHVHVPETTPVHVHMRRSPRKTSQRRIKDSVAKGDGGRAKVKAPWIPPGRLSCRRDRSRVQHQSESGVGHQRDEEEQDEEVAAVSKNLSLLLQEHESIHHLKRSDSRGQYKDTEALLRMLVEAEIDGVAVANQLTALKDSIHCLVKDKRLSKVHAASLARQQSLLLEKVEMFDHTNHNLRELLRDWSEDMRESLVWQEQKDALKKRLAESEADNIRLVAKLAHKEKEASKLAEHLDFEKLQNYMASFYVGQRMQQSHKQQQKELLALQDELQTLKQQRDEKEDEKSRRDREALVLVTQQAIRVEESARQLTEKLLEKESQLAHALSTSSDWCTRHAKEAAAREHLEEEVSALRVQVTELTSQLYASEEKIRAEREKLRDQFHNLSAENASSKLDNQKLKVELLSSEENLRGFQSEVHQLKSSIKKYENLLEKYKKKVHQVRMESDEYRLKLEMMQKEAREVKVSLEREMEQVRKELLGRLRELEALPERLRRTEQQLRDAQQEADAHQRRNMEHSSALSDVRHRVEQQGSQLETFQQRNVLLQEENNVFKEKIHNLERKLEDTKVENEEKCQTLSLKEASIRSIQQQLEEKSRECSALSRQLQQTLDDAHKQVNDSMQRVLAKERTSQSKSLDLQSQLNRAKTELSQLQRSKEEMEQRFQTQLQNMKDRLEQSDSTNRSLQNYVQFLKTSYGNVFGDSLLTS
ncbi:outer dense fiber protein 2-like isoform X3 [Betta splendens]|uniref:Outer dense fiber protein 2 n=1 Tax=Betta splendens TaxID=158456 RepID=A0A6P7NBY9_BETSP|nr:outer dense fiber protein 2-like isoform X3 [Betta splendens]